MQTGRNRSGDETISVRVFSRTGQNHPGDDSRESTEGHDNALWAILLREQCRFDPAIIPTHGAEIVRLTMEQNLVPHRIRSIVIVQKPDGRYFYIGYATPKNQFEKARNRLMGVAEQKLPPTVFKTAARVGPVSATASKWSWGHKKATALIAAGIVVGLLLLAATCLTLTDSWFQVDPLRPRPTRIPPFL